MTLEEQYIEEALKYKREKDNCKWWQFKKKAELESEGKEAECDCKMFIGGSGELCPECKTKVKLNLNKSNTKIKMELKK